MIKLFDNPVLVLIHLVVAKLHFMCLLLPHQQLIAVLLELLIVVEYVTIVFAWSLSRFQVDFLYALTKVPILNLHLQHHL